MQSARTFHWIIAIGLLVLTYISDNAQGGHPVPYALSPVYLQYLEDLETQVYQLLKNTDSKTLFGKDAEEKQPFLLRYLEDYESSVNKSSITNHHEKDFVSSNPILALQMINRFVKYIKSDALKSATSVLVGKDILPTETEVEDGMEALLRVQYIYDLDAHQIANGMLDGTTTSAKLSVRECFELGKFAQDSAYFTLALQWYDVTLQKLKANDDSSSRTAALGLKEHFILNAIRATIDEHNDDYEENIADGDMYSFSTRIYNTNYSDIAHLSLRKRLTKELTGKFLPDKDPLFYQAVEANMMALCHGQNLQPEKEKAKLKCWLDTKRHPYWTINPLKIELLHEQPPITQFYDIFNDQWSAYLQFLSYEDLERAPDIPEATPRTAAYAWFEDNDIPYTPISKMVEFITGLNVVGSDASEALQVAAYAFGGHVEPHFDSVPKGPEDPFENPRGDRVTTFLVYLNEVEKGGRTAFPLLGFYVKPVKNSAVLWYTNLKNGDVDERTIHAACPVIAGQKWIATKWTHIKENILKRPCGLTPDE
ncbi:Prolyl 4-hydroxylase subunit alpha-2 [Orchesella cincta]|uniref:procollagen-proline 4-dioxygenase n=1 Tax=Orchesella cincta TaxID=48709 RepID=A0A1D2NA27_ORCCI|nr:Prolyl 4-hydroxylase subunit alpha-2 [Orchesella cincta]